MLHIVKKIYWMIAALITLSLILFLLSVYGVIWNSGNMISMRYNIDLSVDSNFVELVSYSYEKNREKHIEKHFISEPGYLDNVNVWIPKDKGILKLFFSSWGVQGGSSYMGDTTNIITVLVNNRVINLNEDENFIRYTVYRGNDDLQEVEIRMFFKNDYLFAVPQELNKTLIIHWLSDEAFEQLKQEKLREQEN